MTSPSSHFRRGVVSLGRMRCGGWQHHSRQRRCLPRLAIATRTAVVARAGEAVVAALTQDVCAVVVASAGCGAARRVGFANAEVPVIRVPTQAGDPNGLGLLYDRGGNLPAGPTDGVFATMAIGEAGAKNAALFVVSVLATRDARLRAAWAEFRTRQTDAVLRNPPLTLEE